MLTHVNFHCILFHLDKLIKNLNPSYFKFNINIGKITYLFHGINKKVVFHKWGY